MNAEPDQGLGWLFARCDPAIARQLRKLPAFAVPDDTDSVFGHLLEKLEQAVSAESSPPDVSTPMSQSQPTPPALSSPLRI